MLRKFGRLFVIKTRIEAFLIIYALALGATSRGSQYLVDWPGWEGKALFVASMGAVFLAGAKICDALRYEREARVEAKSSKGPTTQSRANEPNRLR